MDGICQRKATSRVAANATCLTVSDRGPRNSSRQKTTCTPVVIRIFEHHAGDSTFWLGSTPILKVVPGDGQGLPPLFPSVNLTRGLVARRLFRVPPCHESTTHLQTSMPSLRYESRPNHTAVNVTNCNIKKAIFFF
ncbi:hypothetical protein TNCV_2859931 [Trichonephila clavipes]|nr:hypothetical protein TNCV_2859931 [Trichonephila clavipes]